MLIMLFLGLRYPSSAFLPVTLIKDGILKIFVIEMDPALIIYLVLKDFPHLAYVIAISITLLLLLLI